MPFIDAVAGTTVDINPVFVVSRRADPDAVSIVKLSDGETLRIRGDHRDAAAKLRRIAAYARVAAALRLITRETATMTGKRAEGERTGCST